MRSNDRMSQDSVIPANRLQLLREARGIIHDEATALLALESTLGAEFCDAVRAVCDCSGSVMVTGVGKAGLIGQKIVATLSSTGTRSHFLHPTEAVHGDLGCLDSRDVLLVLSNSGESEEIVRLLPILQRLGTRIIAITKNTENSLSAVAEITIPFGNHHEAGTLKLAPSTSTTVMLALGDALALVVSGLKGFTRQQFAQFHPAGSLGQQLKPVREVMRSGDGMRIAVDSRTVRDVMVSLCQPGRRSGAVILTDRTGRLSGIFTDSDLARLLEQRREDQIDRPIAEVMTVNPTTIRDDVVLSQAVELMSALKLSELPVTDARSCPVGVLDITDVLGGLSPVASVSAEADSAPVHRSA